MLCLETARKKTGREIAKWKYYFYYIFYFTLSPFSIAVWVGTRFYRSDILFSSHFFKRTRFIFTTVIIIIFIFIISSPPHCCIPPFYRTTLFSIVKSNCSFGNNRLDEVSWFCFCYFRCAIIDFFAQLWDCESTFRCYIFASFLVKVIPSDSFPSYDYEFKIYCSRNVKYYYFTYNMDF